MYRNHPSMYKFIILINNVYEKIIRNLGVFIQKAFELETVYIMLKSELSLNTTTIFGNMY